MDATGNSLAVVRAAIKAHGLQKQLAYELGMSEANLSKFIDGQLPVFAKLLTILHMEVIETGEVEDLKRVLAVSLMAISAASSADMTTAASSVR